MRCVCSVIWVFGVELGFDKTDLLAIFIAFGNFPICAPGFRGSGLFYFQRFVVFRLVAFWYVGFSGSCFIGFLVVSAVCRVQYGFV